MAGRPACAPRSRAQTRRPSGARRAAGAHTCPASEAGSRCCAAVRGTGGREGKESGRRRGPCSGGRRTRPEALDAAPQAPPHHGPEAAALPLPVLGLARAVSGARAPQPRGSSWAGGRRGALSAGQEPQRAPPSAGLRHSPLGPGQKRGSRPAPHLSHCPLDMAICLSRLGGCSFLCNRECGDSEINGLLLKLLGAGCFKGF